MKKIIIAMAAIAAAFTMASCSKDQPVSPNENPTVGKSVITASIENDLTKTTLEGNDDEGYKVFWSAGDDLFVADAFFECWAAKYTLDNESADSQKGTFSWHTGDTFIPVDESYQEGPAFKLGKYYIALYPFALIGEEVGEYLIWKTEQTYDETDRYIPMYSELKCTDAGTADFTFKNLGGLLRLTVKGSATICSIKIEAKEAMSGSFSLEGEDADGVTMAVAAVGADVANYIILDCGEDGVGLTESGTDFYISIPCRCICEDDQIDVLVGYSDVTITLTDTDGRTCVKKLNNKNGLVIERSKITTATFTASEFNANVPEGALPGKFSVRADKQVYFSQGNLTATIDETGAPTAWKFATNQYDYRGEGGANMTIGTAAGDVDLFGWSTAATAYGISASTNVEDYSGAFVDWGKTIGDGNTWRTLTTEEWQYLFNGRTVNGDNGEDKSYSVNITYGGKTGLVLYPDDYDKEPISGTVTELPEGVVFLPAAGDRYGDEFEEFGCYWSSSADGEQNAFCLLNDDRFVFPDYPIERQSGNSVRLVTDCE